MPKRKKLTSEQLALGFPEDVCLCGCPASGHNKSGECQRCLECRAFRVSPLATFAVHAADVVNRNLIKTTEQELKKANGKCH